MTRFAIVFLLSLLFFHLPAASAEEAGRVLTVNECVVSALANHPDLAAARGDVEVAKAKILAAMSPRYPQITSLNSYYRYAYQYGSGGSSSSLGLSSGGINSNLSTALTSLLGGLSTSVPSVTYYDYYTGNIALNQLLIDWGKTRNNVMVANEGLSAAQYDLITKQHEIILQARQAFYEALANYKLVEVKKEAVSQQKEHLDQAEAFFKEGIKAKIDVTKAEVDMAKAELDLIKAKNSYEVSLVKLSNAMGRGMQDEERYDLQDPLTMKKVTFELPTLLKQAVDNRPELKKLAANIRSNSALKKVAEVQNMPNISLIGAYNWQGQSFPLPYYYYYGTQITFTLFDGYLANASAREAEGNVKILKAQVDSQLQVINLDVKQGYKDLAAAIEAVEVSEKSLQQAQENYDLAKGRYNTGVGSAIEFTDALVSLTGSKSDYISSLTQYKIALATLEKAIGIVVEE